jgi:hypothetical protein
VVAVLPLNLSSVTKYMALWKVLCLLPIYEVISCLWAGICDYIWHWQLVLCWQFGALKALKISNEHLMNKTYVVKRFVKSQTLN